MDDSDNNVVRTVILPGHSASAGFSDGLGRAARRAGRVLLIVTLAFLTVYALIQLRLVVIPAMIALLLAAAFRPLIDLLRRAHFTRLLATWTTLLAAVAVLGGIITAVVFAVSSQWNQLLSNASKGLAQIERFVAQGPLPFTEQQLMQAREAAISSISNSLSTSTVIAGLTTFATFLTAFLLTVVILFFLLDDGPKIWNFFLRPFHGAQLERGHRIGRSCMATLGGYVRGTALIALIDATFIGIGLAILGVPLALPLAVIIFLGAFIPIIGATIAGTLAVLVALVSGGFTTALIAAAIVIAVQQLEGNILQPMIMGQTVKLHPLAILLALAAGTLLAGVIGAVLAVPVAAVTWTIIKVWNEPHEAEQAHERGPK